MINDPLDDFVEYDFVMGSDEVKCPHCGQNVSVGLLMGEDEIHYPKCRMKFKTRL